MNVVSVNVGQARTIRLPGQGVETGIYKSPVAGPRYFGHTAVEGDQVVDLTVHGGTHKAAYLYPHEHYDYWREQLPSHDLAHGFFGENLTTTGVDEQSLCVGDRLAIGEAEFIVSEPRFPCSTLGAKVGRQTFIKQFLESGRTGIYLFVAREGRVAAGDDIAIVTRDPQQVPIAEFVRLYAHAKIARHDAGDLALIERLLCTEILDPQWRARFTQRLADLKRTS